MASALCLNRPERSDGNAALFRRCACVRKKRRPELHAAKLHEEAMALPSEEYAERKRPEQPALATFNYAGDIALQRRACWPNRRLKASPRRKDNVAATQPAQPGLFGSTA